MGIKKNGFKLEKLKIHAYEDSARGQEINGSPFEAMFNPESYNESYGVTYAKNVGLNNNNENLNYAYKDRGSMSLTLVLDSSYVSDFGFEALDAKSRPSISERFEKFKSLAYHEDGKSHEPRYLRVIWGKSLKYDCRLQSADIKYTSFDRSGEPTRAELSITLISDQNAEDLMRKSLAESNDNTQEKIVRNQDNLPNMCEETYNSSDHYLKVARENDLDSVRSVEPGQYIIFPPLHK